ncbi:MAG: polysaccharide deacetylase family protein [Bacteroidales bacterium]|nr:polysaccharide deacetylase family protein [Bacteroidales bacterium]
MLKFNTVFPVFILIQGIQIPLFWFDIISIWFLIVLLAAFLLLVIDGSMHIQRNFYFKSINELKNKQAVLLTFDDGPDPKITPQVLDILDKNQVKAIFFLIGEKAEKYPELVKEIVKRGHSLGNHSFMHSHWFDFFCAKEMHEEITKTTSILSKLGKQQVKYFRPPFGVTNPNLKKALTKTNLLSVGWTFRSFDTLKNKSAEEIAARIKATIKGGEILLFHDNRKKAVDVLELALPFLSNFEQGDLENETN